MFKYLFLCVMVALAPVTARADGPMKLITGSIVSGSIQGGMVADEVRRSQQAAVGNDLVWEMRCWRERVKDIATVRPAHHGADRIRSFYELVNSSQRGDRHSPGMDGLRILRVLMVPASGSDSRAYVMLVTHESNLHSEDAFKEDCTAK